MSISVPEDDVGVEPGVLTSASVSCLLDLLLG